MLTLAGRRRLLGLALGSSLLLGGLPCAAADDVVELPARPNPRSVPAPAAELQASETEGVVVPLGDLLVPPGKQVTNDSHRRRTAEPPISARSSRRSHGQSTTELPIERLRHYATGDVNVQAGPTDRATLTEVMRRLAGWTDSCPLCGKACPLCGKSQVDQDEALPGAVVPAKPSTDRPMLGRLTPEQAGDEALSRPLRAGEPAQIILDTQSRLGKSVLEGTEFGGSPELLIQWIRALDEENRRQQAMLEEVSRADVDEVEENVSAVTGPSQIEALRNACRQLQEAADLLEEQNLFESADSVRGVVEALRRQSRHKVGDLEVRRTVPRLTERVEECDAEDCEGDHE